MYTNIPGANSGIGYDTTLALASTSPNYHCHHGCRNLEKGAQALKSLQSLNPVGSLSLLQVDVTNDDSLSSAVDKISAQFGVVDVLINNAGLYYYKVDITPAQRKETLDINFRGTVKMCQAFLPILRENGRIVNMSSQSGQLKYFAMPLRERFVKPA